MRQKRTEMIDRTIGNGSVGHGSGGGGNNSVQVGVMNHNSSLFSQSFKSFNPHDMVRIETAFNLSFLCVNASIVLIQYVQ